MQHFRLSFAVTVVLMCLAGWWGYEHGGTAGLLSALWITAVLGVLEVSLSFDNAVVNASVLRHWNEFWRKLFLTVGILIAVFGMRLPGPGAIYVSQSLNFKGPVRVGPTKPATLVPTPSMDLLRKLVSSM